MFGNLEITDIYDYRNIAARKVLQKLPEYGSVHDRGSLCDCIEGEFPQYSMEDKNAILELCEEFFLSRVNKCLH